jgi:ribosomal protein S6
MQERVYDLIFIARPATPEEEIKKVSATIEHACTRKLAYKVMKHREGIYVYHQIRTTHAELMQEIERRLGVLDSIIKYQTVRLDEALKLQKKLSHKREIRAARRPRRPVAATPSAPTPPAPSPSAPAATQAAPEHTAPTS